MYIEVEKIVMKEVPVVREVEKIVTQQVEVKTEVSNGVPFVRIVKTEVPVEFMRLSPPPQERRMSIGQHQTMAAQTSSAYGSPYSSANAQYTPPTSTVFQQHADDIYNAHASLKIGRSNGQYQQGSVTTTQPTSEMRAAGGGARRHSMPALSTRSSPPLPGLTGSPKLCTSGNTPLYRLYQSPTHAPSNADGRHGMAYSPYGAHPCSWGRQSPAAPSPYETQHGLYNSLSAAPVNMGPGVGSLSSRPPSVHCVPPVISPRRMRQLQHQLQTYELSVSM